MSEGWRRCRVCHAEKAAIRIGRNGQMPRLRHGGSGDRRRNDIRKIYGAAALRPASQAGGTPSQNQPPAFCGNLLQKLWAAYSGGKRRVLLPGVQGEMGAAGKGRRGERRIRAEREEARQEGRRLPELRKACGWQKDVLREKMPIPVQPGAYFAASKEIQEQPV